MKIITIMVLLISIVFSQIMTITSDDTPSAIITKDVHISFILDETGSMWENRQETISSFNEYLDMLKEKDNRVFMTLTKFNSSKTTVIYNDVNVNYLCGLSDKTYYPNNMTPLYDAIGKTINDIGEVDNMLFVILTDGLENASREYTQSSIFKLIKEKKCEGWTFVFMGANQDSYVAEAIGITAGNIIIWDVGIGTSVPMQQLISNTSNYITNDAVQATGFFTEEEK